MHESRVFRGNCLSCHNFTYAEAVPSQPVSTSGVGRFNLSPSRKSSRSGFNNSMIDPQRSIAFQFHSMPFPGFIKVQHNALRTPFEHDVVLARVLDHF
jgi:hypothetical protein